MKTHSCFTCGASLSAENAARLIDYRKILERCVIRLGAVVLERNALRAQLERKEGNAQ
jgi:hypothetical protein